MTKLDELRKVAGAATPGPWWHDGRFGVGATDSDQLNNNYFVVSYDGPDKTRNMDFIALANPQTILFMCDLLEQMRDALIIGLDLAVAEATRFHEAYAGYKKCAHIAVDEDAEQIRTALAAFDKWNNEQKG